MRYFYFFGVMHAGEAGHFLYRGSDGIFAGAPYPETPVVLRPSSIDGLLTHRLDRGQGAARVCRKEGYTFLAWHDYTGDSRPGSNSIFIAEGSYNFTDMIQLYVHHLPPSITGRQRLPYLVDVPA